MLLHTLTVKCLGVISRSLLHKANESICLQKMEETQPRSLSLLLFLSSFPVCHVRSVGKLQPLARADVVIVFGL